MTKSEKGSKTPFKKTITRRPPPLSLSLWVCVNRMCCVCTVDTAHSRQREVNVPVAYYVACSRRHDMTVSHKNIHLCTTTRVSQLSLSRKAASICNSFVCTGLTKIV